jgi:hypothetical protein
MATGGGKVGNVVGKAAVRGASRVRARRQYGSRRCRSGCWLRWRDDRGRVDGSGHRRRSGRSAGGAAGVGLGKGIGYVAGKAQGLARCRTESPNAGKDAAGHNAQASGLRAAAHRSQPGPSGSIAEGLVRGRSRRANPRLPRISRVTNELAQKELGLPASRSRLTRSRTSAAMRARLMTRWRTWAVQDAERTYDAALDKIVDPYLQASKSFPGAKVNPIVSEIESLRTP